MTAIKTIYSTANVGEGILLIDDDHTKIKESMAQELAKRLVEKTGKSV